jgi:TatD DNase family protein
VTGVLVDTHCHLDAAEFDLDRDAVITSGHRAGVDGVIIPAVEVGNFDSVRLLAQRVPGGAYALGIHPLFVDRAQDSDLEQLAVALKRHCDDPRLVAVGEIGLDHFVPGLDRVRQQRFFEAQLRLAGEFGLPAILHVRRAQDSILGCLRRHPVCGGIAHAFNGSLQQAMAYRDLGFALGMGGAMTDPRALRIRRLATQMALEDLVLETDAPDISPIWRRGERNSSVELPQIAATLAALRASPLEMVIAATGRTAMRVLPKFERVLVAASP